MNFGWSQIETAVSSKLAPLKKYKWRILAVTVFLAVLSPVAVVTYLSSREQPVYMDDEQWGLFFDPESGFPRTLLSDKFPKFYKIVLESIDDLQGTVHLRAELKTITPDLKRYIPERFRPDQTRQNPVPVEVLFGRFTIQDDAADFPSFGIQYSPSGRAPRPTMDFSESAPTSTQADVLLEGTPSWSWWYPFDKYLIAARVGCEVLVTADRKEYFRLPSDGYTLLSKLPNFVVRVANAKDAEYWVKLTTPNIKDKQLDEITKRYQPDVWRYGIIRLVLTRPLFPRFFAGFFGIVALVWTAVVATVSDPKQLSLNVFGYFLALWAIRAALAAGAPTGPLFIDYATLGLYALLIAVVAARFIWIRKT